MTDSIRYVGSRRAMNFGEYIAGLCELLISRNRYLSELREAETAVDAERAFDSFLHHNCLAYLAESGSRGNHLARITHGFARTHSRLLLLGDKDLGDLTKYRAIPLHSALQSIV